MLGRHIQVSVIHDLEELFEKSEPKVNCLKYSTHSENETFRRRDGFGEGLADESAFRDFLSLSR